MFNPESNRSDSSESSYGYNSNGTEKDPDDLSVDNPDYSGEHMVIDEEEEAEIRALYPGEYDIKKPETLEEALRMLRVAALTAQKALEYANSIGQQSGQRQQAQNVGGAALKADSVSRLRQEESADQSIGAQPINPTINKPNTTTPAEHYIASDGVVFTNRKDYLDYVEGLK